MARRRFQFIKPGLRGQLGASIFDLAPGYALSQNLSTTLAAQQQADCLAQANASAQVSNLDAKWYDLAQNWHPSGVYSPSDVDKITQAGLTALQQAKVIVIMAPPSTSDQDTVRAQALDDIDKQSSDAARFVTASAQARAKGGASVVRAPDLKDWLVSSLLAASNGFVTAAVLQCNVTWLDTAATYIDNAKAAVWNIAGEVAETVIAAGGAVIDAAGSAFGFVAFLVKWLPASLIVLGLAGTGYWLYRKRGGKFPSLLPGG